MSLTAAAIRLLADKGLSASDIADVAEAMQPSRTSNAESQARYRERKKSHNENNVTRNVTPPPNDIYSNPPNPQSSNDDCPPLAERVVSAWNEQSPNGLTKSRGLDANRRKALAARVKDHGEAAVFDAIRRLGASPWHCGQNDRGWTANLGWLLKSPENFLKSLELPEPPEKPKPVDRAAHLASKIEFYRKIGKDWEADECQRELARLTGPPDAACQA